MYFANSQTFRAGFLVLVCFAPAALGQLSTATIEGSLHDRKGQPLAGVALIVRGGAGLRQVINTGAQGDFTLTIPYGRYLLQ
jgi:hypothetical protein